MKHPANSYRDLAPLISTGTADGPAPKKFIVFFNSRKAAQAGAKFLCSRLPEHEVDEVTWVHSGMLDEFRQEEVYALKIGPRKGTCATDALGMVHCHNVRLDMYLLDDIVDRGSIYQTSISQLYTVLWSRSAPLINVQVELFAI